MRIYELDNGTKWYWTINKSEGFPAGYWSSFKQDEFEKRDFFIINALFLYLAMKLNGNKCKLEIIKNE